MSSEAVATVASQWKASFASGEIRRFELPYDASLAALVGTLTSMSPPPAGCDVVVGWKDEDGDWVTIRSDAELRVAVSAQRKSGSTAVRVEVRHALRDGASPATNALAPPGGITPSPAFVPTAPPADRHHGTGSWPEKHAFKQEIRAAKLEQRAAKQEAKLAKWEMKRALREQKHFAHAHPKAHHAGPKHHAAWAPKHGAPKHHAAWGPGPKHAVGPKHGAPKHGFGPKHGFAPKHGYQHPKHAAAHAYPPYPQYAASQWGAPHWGGAQHGPQGHHPEPKHGEYWKAMWQAKQAHYAHLTQAQYAASNNGSWQAWQAYPTAAANQLPSAPDADSNSPLDHSADSNTVVPMTDLISSDLEKNLEKIDLAEIREMVNPPPQVKMAVEALHIVLNNKQPESWPACQIFLGEAVVVERLRTGRIIDVSDATIDLLAPYVADPNFQVAKMAAVSEVCSHLCRWVHAIVAAHAMRASEASVKEIVPLVPLERPNPRQRARFVSDVTCEPGTEYAPGALFTKTWRFRNDTADAWPEGTCIQFVSRKNGDLLGAPDSGIVLLPSGSGVGNGAETDVSVDFCAPDEPGSYEAFWRLCEPSGRKFGQRVRVSIVVSGSSDSPGEGDDHVSSDDGEHRGTWGAALRELEAMGFTDRRRNVRLLVKFSGNMDRVVMRLLARAERLAAVA